MKAPDHELRQLKEALAFLEEGLAEKAPPGWDRRTSAAMAGLLRDLVSRVNWLAPEAPAYLVRDLVRQLLKEGAALPADGVVADAMMDFAFQAELQGHVLGNWEEDPEGGVVLRCTRCGDAVLVTVYGVEGAMAERCPHAADDE